MLVFAQFIFTPKFYAQNIAINEMGSLPDTSAMLDVSSTTKGFLTPRMTTTQQNSIPSPANGLLIYSITDNVFKVNTGTTTSPVWTPLLFSGSSITSINGLTTGTQTFATGNAGTNFNIASTGSTHTLNIPDASTTARGLVTTDAQVFAGDKTFNGSITATNLATGSATDEIVTATAAGVLKKRTVASFVSGSAWATEGNNAINSGNQFLGSINNASVRFRTYNIERMVIDSVGNVGVGVTSPRSRLQINGAIATAIATTTDNNVILTDAHSTFLMSMSGSSNRNIYLPSAINITGRIYTIKRVGAGIGSLTLYANGTQKIDENNTYTNLTVKWKYVTLQSDGSNWVIIANN